MGLESIPPSWVCNDGSIHYVRCNLMSICSEKSARATLEQIPKCLDMLSSIVVGVRPPLIAPYAKDDHDNQRVVRGIQYLLQAACELCPRLNLVLHISSVAAMDHLRTQHMLSEKEPFPISLQEYPATYDRFKRACEETITTVCEKRMVPFCHLRLSAIFSDDHACIQCRALHLQRFIGPYLPVAIDCNSSANVSRAIDSLLRMRVEQEQDATKRPPVQNIYHYTRPLALKSPMPYGYYLQQYRMAHNLERTSIWIPVWVVTCLVALVHSLAHLCSRLNISIPYLDAFDYLLQVSSREHSFDCSLFGNDFPELQEESILECFQRHRELLKRDGNGGVSTPGLKKQI